MQLALFVWTASDIVGAIILSLLLLGSLIGLIYFSILHLIAKFNFWHRSPLRPWNKPKPLKKPTEITVEVTAEDIELGRPKDKSRSSSCPIARAINRHTLHPVVVGLGSGLCKSEDVRREARFDLPLAAIEFVRSFDKRIPVEPFSFKLTIPAGVILK